MASEAVLTNKIFLTAALPLIRVIGTDVPNLAKMYENMHAVFQLSAIDPDSPCGKVGTHFTVNNGEWRVCADKVATNAFVDLEFKSIDAMNSFLKGKISPATLPKMKGALKHPKVFAALIATLLKMSSVLTAKTAPAAEEDKQLMVKCYFYLLSSGISQLNKQGHEAVHEWALKSPDRVYAWAVDNHPEVSAYLRVKAGKTRAGRGAYKRAMPFFTMRFDSLDSALGILMSTDDMLESTKAGKLIMDGAPEFGAQIGDYMMLVGSYAQG